MKIYFLVFIITFYGFSTQANELIDVVEDKDSEINDVRNVIKYSEITVNDRDVGGNTALHWAYYRRRQDIIDVLLAAGANPRIKNNSGNTASEIGSFNGNAHVRRLVESKNPMKTTLVKRPLLSRVNTVFMELLHNGTDNQVLQYLSEQSLDLYTINKALHVVIDKPEVLRVILVILLSKGGNVHFVNSFGEKTLLQKAAIKGNLKLVSALLSFGAHPNSPVSTLMDGITSGSPQMVSLLLASGAKITNIDQALEEAVHIGKPQIVSIVLNTYVKDYNGKAALDWARKNNKPEVVRLLESANGKGNRCANSFSI